MYGWFVTRNITVESSYPNPKELELLTNYTSYNNEIYNNIQYTQDIQRYKNYKREISHPRAKHAPSGFHPTWTAFTGNLIT